MNDVASLHVFRLRAGWIGAMLFLVLPFWAFVCAGTTILMHGFMELDYVAAAPASSMAMMHLAYWIGVANVVMALGFAALYYFPMWMAARHGYQVEVLPEMGAIQVPGEGTAFVSRDHPGLTSSTGGKVRDPFALMGMIVLRRSAPLEATGGGAIQARRAAVRLLRLARFGRLPEDLLVINTRMLRDRARFQRLLETMRSSPARDGATTGSVAVPPDREGLSGRG